MTLTRLSLEKFKRLFLQEFGKELSDTEAERRARYFLEVYRVVLGLPGVEEFFDNQTNEKNEK
ncbi:MAG: hypothetical protein Q8P72_07120 [Candidatus Roizmanbacteria bacterium]|nr:hypothetical protein [Candidatus Roizmanbacteria bacterium]